VRQIEEKSMENSENPYKTKYDRLNREVEVLRKTVNELRDKLTKEQNLLEECWERIYYKKSWLTLCNDNIDGMKKHIEAMKIDGRYDKLMLEE